MDKDLGPFFIKFCSYLPYTSKLCLNGHEYLKRQLALRGVDFSSGDLASLLDTWFGQLSSNA